MNPIDRATLILGLIVIATVGLLCAACQHADLRRPVAEIPPVFLQP